MVLTGLITLGRAFKKTTGEDGSDTEKTVKHLFTQRVVLQTFAAQLMSLLANTASLAVGNIPKELVESSTEMTGVLIMSRVILAPETSENPNLSSTFAAAIESSARCAEVTAATATLRWARSKPSMIGESGESMMRTLASLITLVMSTLKDQLKFLYAVWTRCRSEII